MQKSFVPEPEWFFTLIPALVNFIVIVVVSLLTQKSCPPKALISHDNEIIKWPELVEADKEG